jgi:phospholipid/cholesterol/gamma-HCH transport system permease protein
MTTAPANPAASPDPADEDSSPRRGPLAWPLGVLEYIGARTLGSVEHIGSVMALLWQATLWLYRGLTTRKARLGKAAVISQIVRVGVKSVFIVCVVSGSVGLILSLQLAPPLDELGQRAMIPNIIGVAVFRELGPLIGAIVLTGFAGAAIAAEIGTMVVSEEIEALEAHALNPVRFLVVPRVAATTISMTALGVLSSFVAVAASMALTVVLLGVPYATYMTNLLDQVKVVDFYTGIAKSAIFGMLIGIIACANGLNVTGGAAGVGRATTLTVVQCVVAIIVADLFFTAIFYALKLF